MAQRYLSHYGVRGMKWGVRKALKKRFITIPSQREEFRKNVRSERKARLDKALDRLDKMGEYTRGPRQGQPRMLSNKEWQRIDDQVGKKLLTTSLKNTEKRRTIPP